MHERELMQVELRIMSLIENCRVFKGVKKKKRGVQQGYKCSLYAHGIHSTLMLPKKWNLSKEGIEEDILIAVIYNH
jgi:hypothetical protein